MTTQIISFIIGGIFTLLVFSAGCILGSLITSKKLEQKVQELRLKYNPPKPDSGGVKALTPDEIKKEGNKGFITKMEDLLT